MIALFAAIVLAAAPSSVVTSHRKVVAEDGAALALYRYGSSASRLPPVLVIVDLGFDRSLADPLARFLAERGRTVFVAELRGQGASASGHSLRSLIHLDLPAITKVIGEPVQLIAHGYAGSLAMAAVGHELQVSRVVAFSTPMSPEPPTELQAWFLSDGARFSSLAASPEGAEIFSQLFAMGSALRRGGTRDLSRAMAAELLAWLQTGDLPLDDGTSVLARLHAYDTPTLMFLGLANAWAPSEACVLLRERSRASVQLRSFSRFSDGEDFAHVTALQGASAPSLIFGDVEAFLR